MQSIGLFINSYGGSQILGSIWVGAFLFKHPVKDVARRLVKLSDIPDCFDCQFFQITPARLNATETSHAVQISKAAKYLISCFRIKYPHLNLKLYSAHSDQHAGSLGQPMQIIPSARLDARLTFKACQLVYQRELSLLQPHYPSIDLNKYGASTSHQRYALYILEHGPTFGIRKSFLQRVPAYWLDLLRLNVDWAYEQNWVKLPPQWWIYIFNDTWYTFLSKQQTLDMWMLLATRNDSMVSAYLFPSGII